VKIAPALPNPHPSTTPQRQSVVPAVQAPDAMSEAADRRERLVALKQAADMPGAGPSSTRGEILATRQVVPPPRVAHALASYAQVAGGREHHVLRELLGFDAYA